MSAEGDNAHLSVQDDDIMKELEETDWTEDVPEEGGDEHLDTPVDKDLADDFDPDELECVDEAEVEEEKSRRRDRERRSLRRNVDSSSTRYRRDDHDRNRRDRLGEDERRRVHRLPDRRVSDRQPHRSSRDRESDRARRISSPASAVHKRVSNAKVTRDRNRRQEYLRRQRGEDVPTRPRRQREDELELDELEEIDCCDDDETFSDMTSETTTERTGSCANNDDDIGNAALEGLDDDNDDVECPWAARLAGGNHSQTVSIDDDDEEMFPSLSEDIVDVEAVRRAAALPTVCTIAPLCVSPSFSRSSTSSLPSSAEKDSDTRTRRRTSDERRTDTLRGRTRDSARMERRATETTSSSRRSAAAAADPRPHHPNDSQPPARFARRPPRSTRDEKQSVANRGADRTTASTDVAQPRSTANRSELKRRRSSPASRSERCVRETPSPIRRRLTRPPDRNPSVSAASSESSKPTTVVAPHVSPTSDTVSQPREEPTRDVDATKNVPPTAAPSTVVTSSPPKKQRIEFDLHSSPVAVVPGFPSSEPSTSSTTGDVRPTARITTSVVNGSTNNQPPPQPAPAPSKPIRERIVFNSEAVGPSKKEVPTGSSALTVKPTVKPSPLLASGSKFQAKRSTVAPPTRQQLRDMVIRLDMGNRKRPANGLSAVAAVRHNNIGNKVLRREMVVAPRPVTTTTLVYRPQKDVIVTAASPVIRRRAIITGPPSKVATTMVIERRFKKSFRHGGFIQ